MCRFAAHCGRNNERPQRQCPRHDTGVLAATTAFGKTVLAAWLIAQPRGNTLVLVHRRNPMEQWFERLSEFLGVPAKTIGRLGGGRKKLTGMLDVALARLSCIAGWKHCRKRPVA